MPNKANGYRCVVKPPLSLSERAEQAQAAFVKSVWKPSKRFVQSIPSLPTKAAAFIDDVLIGQGFFNQNTRPIGEAIDLISLKKYAKEPTHRGYNPKIDREYKPGVGLISIAIVMLGLFGGYFLGQTLQRSGDATQAPACMESQAEAAEPKQAKMSPKAGGYPKVTSAPARAKKAPARTGRAASTPLVVVGSQNPVKIASVKAGFDEVNQARCWSACSVHQRSSNVQAPVLSYTSWLLHLVQNLLTSTLLLNSSPNPNANPTNTPQYTGIRGGIL